MLITKENIIEPHVISFIHLLCQWMRCLFFKPIRLYGDIVQNWVAYCYAYNLNPFQYESVVQLVEYFHRIDLPNMIEIWVLPEQEYYKDVIQDLQNLSKMFGYSYRTSKTIQTIQNGHQIQIRKIYCESELSTIKHKFILFIQATEHLNIEFDVDNLYIQCSPNLGIQYLDLIHYTNISIPEKSSEFGFCRTRQEKVFEVIYSILKKQARMILHDSNDVISVLSINKLEMVKRTEKILKRGYQIENHPALKAIFVNELNMESCSICMESFDNTNIDSLHLWVETRCSHIFHQSCLFKWWSEHFPTSCFLQCPNCRNLYNCSKPDNISNNN